MISLLLLFVWSVPPPPTSPLIPLRWFAAESLWNKWILHGHQPTKKELCSQHIKARKLSSTSFYLLFCGVNYYTRHGTQAMHEQLSHTFVSHLGLVWHWCISESLHYYSAFSCKIWILHLKFVYKRMSHMRISYPFCLHSIELSLLFGVNLLWNVDDILQIPAEFSL